ncbi:MAG UNVERIFIED_CONTAM: hypothetical protein LVR29_19120 [Microcystis novacekii LVE1205-3]
MLLKAITRDCLTPVSPRESPDESDKNYRELPLLVGVISERFAEQEIAIISRQIKIFSLYKAFSR